MSTWTANETALFKMTSGAKGSIRLLFIDTELLSRSSFRVWTLYFGQDQIYWECRELIACETMPLGLPARVLQDLDMYWQPALSPEEKLVYGLTGKLSGLVVDMSPTGLNATARCQTLYKLWARTVEEYSLCTMKDLRTKVIGLSAFASKPES
jgi:hypothetical protein